jgi:penicillin-binding protein 2
MLVPDPEWKASRFYGEGWFNGDTANMSIGQGFLLLTPMQMATFAASLASETCFLQPTLLHRQTSAVAGDPIGLTDEQLNLIKEGMRLAGERGTARLAGKPGMPVSGKTGTAQVRKDGKPTTLAWFGSTAAPIAKAVFQEYLGM